MIRFVAIGATLLALFAECASNAIFAYLLGHFYIPGWPLSLDGLVLASVAVAVAVLEAILAKRLLAGELSHKFLGGLAIALSLSFSLATLISHVLQLQRVQADAEQASRHKYDLALAEYKTLQQSVQSLGANRAVSVVETDLKSLPARIDPVVWRESRECMRPTNRYQSEICAPATALAAELAAAVDAAKVKTRYEESKHRLSSLARPEQRSDTERFLAGYMPWLLALVVKMFGTFGFALAASAPNRTVEPIGAYRDARAGSAVVPVYAGPGPKGVSRRSTSRRGAESLITWYDSLDRTSLPSGVIIDKDGWCCSGQGALAASIGVSKPTVSRWLSNLQSSGAIELRTSIRGTEFRPLQA